MYLEPFPQSGLIYPSSKHWPELCPIEESTSTAFFSENNTLSVCVLAVNELLKVLGMSKSELMSGFSCPSEASVVNSIHENHTE